MDDGARYDERLSGLPGCVLHRHVPPQLQIESKTSKQMNKFQFQALKPNSL
jgi:hypothetical protein